MKARLITLKEAQKEYAAGKKAAEARTPLKQAIIEHFQGRGTWSEMKVFEMGYLGVDFEPRKYQRYGDFRTDPYSGDVLPSYNHMDNRPEWGISVITEEWRRTVPGVFFETKYAGRKKVITFWGLDTGYKGGDGEPLVIPIEMPEEA